MVCMVIEKIVWLPSPKIQKFHLTAFDSTFQYAQVISVSASMPIWLYKKFMHGYSTGREIIYIAGFFYCYFSDDHLFA